MRTDYTHIIGEREGIMAILTVSAHGKVTLEKEVMQHLGVKPGDKVEIDLLPDASGMLKAVKPGGKIDAFVGLLAGQTDKVATLQEIDEASAEAWAGRHESNG